MNYSRQRESILLYLRSTKSHPTAEEIYQKIQSDYPAVSLGTVYRNLSLLSDIGEIRRITTLDGPDRFDGNLVPHYHFVCMECGAVRDLEMGSIDHINLLAAHNFTGTIEGHVTHFYGKCPTCAAKATAGKQTG